MLCLGIEGTAHTFGVGICDDDQILANVMDMYRPEEGGIHPREASNHHAAIAADMLVKALDKAGASMSDLDVVAFSQGPGLGPCLRTAATAARTISLSQNIPLVGVNHCIAHLEIGRLTTQAEDPIMLYVSGGNTQVIAYTMGRYRIFGETLDIGIGNMLDKFGRESGLPFPAGPVIEKMAVKSNRLLDLPYSVKGMDVSFSGILTAALQQVKEQPMEDLCNTLQETCFAMLVEVSERAMAHADKSELVLGGGVARNKRLQEMCGIMAEERGGASYMPPPDLCVDNGAMIAYTGFIMNKAGISIPVEDSAVNQRFRTDQVEVTWR